MSARLLLAVMLLWALEAQAHTRSISYSSWSLDEQGGRVSLRLSALDRTLLQARGPALQQHLTSALRLRSDEGLCKPEDFKALNSGARAWHHFEWTLRCSGPPVSIESDLLFTERAGHIHLLRLDRSEARVLSESSRSFVLDGSVSILGFVRAGWAHILGGWDHILFVLLLVVAAPARRLRDLAVLVTGFTIGHSLTLTSSVMGLAKVETAMVEALIALSIIALALENLSAQAKPLRRYAVFAVGLPLALALIWPRGAFLGMALFIACAWRLRGLRARIASAALFGAVHGLGFAGALVTWPTEQRVRALFAFNVGVELGQLLVVALAWFGLRWLDRIIVIRATALIALSTGSYWLVQRLSALG